jgi:hypothetical protein
MGAGLEPVLTTSICSAVGSLLRRQSPIIEVIA